MSQNRSDTDYKSIVTGLKKLDDQGVEDLLKVMQKSKVSQSNGFRHDRCIKDLKAGLIMCLFA